MQKILLKAGFLMVLGLSAGALFSCSTSQVQTQPRLQVSESSNRKVNSDLTHAYAIYRGNRISQVAYDLTFNLSEVEKDFTGQARIQFQLKEISELALDFAGGSIQSIESNGNKLDPADYNGQFLILPKNALVLGANTITIQFAHPYGKDGSGLSRFQDPVDERFYLHTDFEPYDAHQVFPCFDQPDLKATFTLNVYAPKEWTVITSVRESGIKDLYDEQGSPTGRRLWTFPESAQFSTYLFSLFAGQYQMWAGSAGEIPLRLFARHSMAKYVPTQEWFKLTQAGFRYFNKNFDYRYPFKKYDQIIVPDYRTGAMENVGAVTFSERLLPRGNITRIQRLTRAATILHEMAHMWFGNLVTMKWWNDLWLNESFATFAGNSALAEATEFSEAWKIFFSYKKGAYWEDRLVTTHPIEGFVPDTNQAMVNFDGISYIKGASVLKQLSLLVGPDHFKKGIQNYFKTHQYSNADLNDFISSIESASGISLSQWKNDWLQTAGPNRIQANFECASGKVSSFNLVQTALPETPTLRAHKTIVGLYKKNQSGNIALADRVTVQYQGPTTPVADAVGKTCPDLVNLNESDQDFVLTSFDPTSTATLRNSLSKISDPLTRMMAWASIWDQVQFAVIPVQEYIALVERHLPKETDMDITLKVLGSLNELLDYLPHYLPPHPHAPISRGSVAARLEKFLWKGLNAAQQGSDVQKYYWDTLVSVSENPEYLARISDFLQNITRLNGLNLDQDRRWAAIKRINSYDPPIGEPLRLKEESEDKTNIGKNASMAAEVSQPLLEVKNQWWARVVSENTDLSATQIRTVLYSFFPRNQEKFRRHFGERYFQLLPKFSRGRSPEFTSTFARALPPTLCEPASEKKLGDFVASNMDLPPIALKPVRVAHQWDGRCVKVRELAERTSGLSQKQPLATTKSQKTSHR